MYVPPSLNTPAPIAYDTARSSLCTNKFSLGARPHEIRADLTPAGAEYTLKDSYTTKFVKPAQYSIGSKTKNFAEL